MTMRKLLSWAALLSACLFIGLASFDVFTPRSVCSAATCGCVTITGGWCSWESAGGCSSFSAPCLCRLRGYPT